MERGTPYNITLVIITFCLGATKTLLLAPPKTRKGEKDERNLADMLE